MGGIEEPELYARWVQFGVFSPILRLHSTTNPFHERRPWGYGEDVFRVTRNAMQLRHALIPYIYSMAWRTTQEAIPLVTPLYYWHGGSQRGVSLPQPVLVRQRADGRALRDPAPRGDQFEPAHRLAAGGGLVRLHHRRALRGRPHGDVLRHAGRHPGACTRGRHRAVGAAGRLGRRRESPGTDRRMPSPARTARSRSTRTKATRPRTCTATMRSRGSRKPGEDHG